MTLTSEEQDIIAALDNRPQTLQELAASCYVQRRAVEAAIQHARLEGIPIASDERGVWRTDDPAELRATEAALRRRVTKQLRTYSAVKRTRQKLEQPKVLFPDLA